MASGSSKQGATTVFVQRDGIVNHMHDGVKGWHNPATRHNAGLHGTADKADVSALTAAQRKQYAEALQGKSAYGAYFAALKARRESAGATWAYGRKAEAPAPVKAAKVRAKRTRKAVKAASVAASVDASQPEA